MNMTGECLIRLDREVDYSIGAGPSPGQHGREYICVLSSSVTQPGIRPGAAAFENKREETHITM